MVISKSDLSQLHQAASKIPSGFKEKHAIIGGGGYVGYHLAKDLVQHNIHVIMLDKRPEPYGPVESGMEYHNIDLRAKTELASHLNGVICVYHMASYGMSGREQFRHNLIHQVNIAGCQQVLEACIAASVPCLVYTSTNNVVFCGQIVVNGDESLPYIPLEQYPDVYSRTKNMAEQLVLSYNGQALANQRGVFNTCAVRLPGIYGPGEERHLPRIVNFLHAGLFKVLVGDASVKTDFIHIANVVQGHRKAGHALLNRAVLPNLQPGQSAGEVYFLSDGKPVNNFEFFRPLVEGLGYEFPTIRLPVSLVYFVALMTEVFYHLVHRVWDFQPFLTRAEVFKTGIYHNFSNAKALAHFGYAPTVQNDLSEAVEWFLVRGEHRKNVHQKQSYSFNNFIIWGVCFIFLLMAILLIH